MQLWVAVKLQ